VSLESKIKDLQSHISQELTNSEGSVLKHIYSAIERTHAHRMWKIHARVRSSALGRPSSVEALKLAYKYHFLL
jgi:hypothetical protein